jgi:nucleoside-diphosphate-sugar epimerase
MQKKVFLITGATGLIGSRLVHRLLGMDNTYVIALSRNESKLNELFKKYIGSDSFDYIAQDVSEHFELESILKGNSKHIDVIFHAASPISGATIQQYPLDVIKPNLNATLCLLDGLVKQQNKSGVNGRIILFSSATVYGQATNSDTCVKETDTATAERLDSVSAPYFESKRMVEVIARSYVKQHNIDAVIVRPSYVYGSAYYPPNTAIYEFISKALSGNDILLNSSGLGRRDNIYIDDVISGLLAVFDKGQTGEAYNISSGSELGNFAAIDEIAEKISKISNISVRYKEIKNSSRLPGIILDNGKLKALGWNLKFSLDDGISKMLSEQRKINNKFGVLI